MFNYADKNKNGKVGMKELVRALRHPPRRFRRRCGRKCRRYRGRRGRRLYKIAKRMIRDVDKNKDGVADLKEVVTFLNKRLAKMPAKRRAAIIRHYVRMFRRADRNKNGKVSAKELARALRMRRRGRKGRKGRGKK